MYFPHLRALCQCARPDDRVAKGVEVTVLTAAEIRDNQFTMTRRDPGYDPEEVDNFPFRAPARPYGRPG